MTEKCTYDPRVMAGKPIGMFHCPECGCMQLAGLGHLECDPNECLVSADDGQTLPPSRTWARDE